MIRYRNTLNYLWALARENYDTRELQAQFVTNELWKARHFEALEEHLRFEASVRARDDLEES